MINCAEDGTTGATIVFCISTSLKYDKMRYLLRSKSQRNFDVALQIADMTIPHVAMRMGACCRRILQLSGENIF